MKYFNFVFLVLLVACQQQSKNVFEVSGTLKNAPGNTIYLVQASFTQMNPLIIDSTKLDNKGHFRLKGSKGEEGLYFLQVNGLNRPFISLVNDADHITVDGDFTASSPFKVQGSPATASLLDLNKQTDTQLSNVYALGKQADSLRNINASDTLLNFAKQRHDKAANDFKSYVLQYINNSKSPMACIIALDTYYADASLPSLKLAPLTEQEKKSFTQTLAQRFPKHQGAAQFTKSLLAEKQPDPAPEQQPNQAGKLINKPAPDFSLPDTSGKMISLSSFKGKYVLVDFWASWCNPCRGENPNVVKAFNQFKNKNFTVLSVSLDKDKKAWLKAIADDHLAWTHVSDLKFWDSKVVPLYGIDGIPYNVLVDPSGIIIAEGLREEALPEKLAQVLK